MNLLLANRQANRLPKNDMDFCTVVSIFPKAIHEERVTIEPGVFDIPAAGTN